MLVFFHNPFANRGEARNKLTRLRERLREHALKHGVAYQWLETSQAGSAAELTERAARDGAQGVIAVGGDGTVHEVVNGLMALPNASRPRLGILPIGSGNDFAHACGIPEDLEEALDVILAGNARAVDIGVIEIGGRREYWTNTIGLGFDAKVTIQSKKYRRLRGFALYLTATLATLIRHHEIMAIDLAVDIHRFSEKLLMLTLANGPREGGGFRTTPASKVDDGRFEMLLVKPLSRLQMLALLPRVMKGTHLTSKSIYYRTFRTLRLHAGEPISLHADGEILAKPEDRVRDVTIAMKRSAIEVFRS